MIGQVPQTGMLDPPSEASIPEMLAAMCKRAAEHLTLSQGEMVQSGICVLGGGPGHLPDPSLPVTRLPFHTGY